MRSIPMLVHVIYARRRPSVLVSGYASRRGSRTILSWTLTDWEWFASSSSWLDKHGSKEPEIIRHYNRRQQQQQQQRRCCCCVVDRDLNEPNEAKATPLLQKRKAKEKLLTGRLIESELAEKRLFSWPWSLSIFGCFFFLSLFHFPLFPAKNLTLTY